MRRLPIVFTTLMLTPGCGSEESPIEPEVLVGKLRQLTTTSGVYPDWSEDGGSIVYASDNGLWTVAPEEGSTPTLFLEMDNSTFKYPCWHPDAARRTVGYIRETEIGPSERSFEIGVFASGDDSPTILFTSTKELTGLDFTSDGTYLAFIKDPSSPSGVWLLPVDGGEARQVSGEFSWDRVRGLSCDRGSDTISFLLWEKKAAAWNVYNIPTTGGMADKISNFPGAQVLVDQERRPDGGSYLVAFYDVGHGREFARTAYNFFIMPAGGGGVEQVTKMVNYTPNNPTWSPDGKAIAFNRWTDGLEDQALFIIELEAE